MDLRSVWRRFGRSTAAGSSSSSSSSSDSDAADPSDAADGGHAGAERHVAAERPSRPAWRDLAPIPRTFQAHPLVAPTVSFSHDLSGHQPAPLALETLGHDRPADAPAGVVTGLFVGHSPHTPVQDETGGTARASVRGRAPRSTEPAAESEPTRLAGSPASAPTGPAPRVSPSPGSMASSVSIAPTHRPVVARSVAGLGAAAAMTSAPPTSHAAPAGSIGRPAVAGSTPATPRPVAGAGLAPAAAVPPSISITATPIEPDAAGLGTVARRNLGQTRRLRIGPAIGPGTLEPSDAGRADGQRSDRTNASGPGASQPDPIRDLTVTGGPPSNPAAIPGPAPTETPGPSPTVARSAAGHAPPDEAAAARQEPRDVHLSAAEPGAPMPVPARPIAPPQQVERAPLVGRLGVTHGGRSVPTTGAPAAPPTPAPRSDTPTPRSDTPTPRSTVQEALAALSGATTNVPPAATVTGGEGGAGWAGPSIQRSASETPWTGTSSASAGSAGFDGRGDVSAPRPGGATNASSPTVAPSVGGWTGAATASRGIASGSWSPPIRQLRSTGSSVAEGSRPAGGHGVVGTVASRTVASSGAGAAPSEPPGGTLWRSADAAHDEGPEPETGEDGGPSDVIQRFEAGATAAAASPITTITAPTVQRADGGEGGAAGAAGAAGSDKELDELARKLFPRLQLRLRSELLIDRERIGALVDLGR